MNEHFQIKVQDECRWFGDVIPCDAMPMPDGSAELYGAMRKNPRAWRQLPHSGCEKARFCNGIGLALSVAMHPFPHRYAVTARVGSEPDIILESAGLSPLRTSLPAEFGGVGDQWSPETLLVASVADCFAMTFRGLAARSHLTWVSLSLEVVGTLDRIDGVTRFVEFRVVARLLVPHGTDESQALRLLEKAEATCLITRSLSGVTRLDPQVQIDAP